MSQTSEDIKAELARRAQTLSDPGQDYDTPGGYGEEEAEIVEDGSEEVGDPEEPEEAPYSFEEEQAEARRQRAEQEEEDLLLAGSQIAAQRGIENPYLKRKQEAQFQQNVQASLLQDMSFLEDRYGDALTERFARDLSLGKIKISALESDNPLEQTFLKWADKPHVRKTLSSHGLKEIIEAASGPPLRSRAKAVMDPESVRPKKPRVRKEPPPEADFFTREFTPERFKKAIELLRDYEARGGKV